ncbi:MAG: inositol monophosphatase [Geminicoccaceae bacterium]|nr:inositol monophosphatase [Geminicoccaceae bacterium]
MPRRSVNLQVMIRAVVKAARNLVRDFGEVEQLQVSMKGPADFVSAADRKAERIIVEELQRMRPEYGFLLEEGEAIKARDGTSRFLLDPLDGTTNFLHGMPHFAISVALEQRGEIVAACIYDPLKDELFAADKGDGAFLNDRRLRVSSRSDMGQALIGCGLPVQDWKGRGKGFDAQMSAVADVCGGLRRLGTASLDLAYVAAGRQDGFWEYGLKPWDIAAGILIIREAGGRVSRIEGDDDLLAEGTIVASNANIHEPLRQLISSKTIF